MRVIARWLSMTMVLILPGLAAPEPGNTATAIDWNERNVTWHGYADGLRAAREQGKNVVLVVYADWCGVCKKYSRMYFDKSVVAASRNVILVRLNQDTDARYLKSFSLDGRYVPRTYILDSDFKVQPSQFKTEKYGYYLPPGNEEYLVELFDWLK